MEIIIKLEFDGVFNGWIASYEYKSQSLRGSIGTGDTPTEAMARLAMQIDYSKIK